MKLKKYSKYKDSWIDWIWEIPESWEVRKLKFLWKIKSSNIDKNDWYDLDCFVVNYNDVIKKPIIKETSILSQTSCTYSQYKSFSLNKNDIIMTKDSMDIRNIADTSLVEWFKYKNLVCWYHLYIIRWLNNDFFSKYYNYTFNNHWLKNYFLSESRWITIIWLSNDSLSNSFLTLPPLKTQQKISSFLDSKTSQIEKLIEKDKNLIVLLKERRVSLINKAVTKGLDDSVKMKDSWVEWIWKIPESWEVKRLFGVCRIVRGNSAFKKDELLDKGKYIALQYWKTYNVDEVNEQFQFYVNNEFYKNSQVVNYWDTILVSTSETVEDLWHTVFYKRKDIGLIGGEQILLKPSTNIIYNKYLFYSSRIFTKRLVQFATWVKVFRFNINDLNTTYLWIPAIEEQQKIVDFLDKETEKIDNHIKKVERRIELYEEYKKSVIYNVVTGKVEV